MPRGKGVQNPLRIHWYLGPAVTFPQASEPLVPGDGPVGVQGAAVPVRRAAPEQAHLRLEADFHHVGGLGHRHRHGSRGAARRQPRRNAGACETGKTALRAPFLGVVDKMAFFFLLFCLEVALADRNAELLLQRCHWFSKSPRGQILST